jgi:hypothetical protein
MSRKMMMMRGLGRTLISVSLILAAAGCYERTITVGAGAPQGPVVFDHWENFWLAGLVGHMRYDLDEICPSGHATIEVYESFLNGLVTGLTGGIYTPTTMKIRCRTGGRAALALSESEVRNIVNDERFLRAVEAAMPERSGEVREAQRLQQDP